MSVKTEYNYCQKVESLKNILSLSPPVTPVNDGNAMESCNNMHTVGMAQFRELFPVSDCVSMGDDFCIINMKYSKSLEILGHPCRFDGFLAFFCISGRFRMMINMREFEVLENSLFINLPGNILRVSFIDETQKHDLHFIVMALTRSYMSGLKMDLHKILEKGMMLLDNPCYVLGEEEKAVAKEYLSLAENVLHSNLMYKRECIGSLLSSIFYLAGGVIERRISEKGSRLEEPSDRGKVIFDRFISLVSEHHSKERGMAFYAEKLCLTPKYLSKLVKASSGRSAPDWIDAYVILEAKNLLKYSDCPVKEIVSRLNFPNASTFHKFFKAKTGLTPTQYRKL